MSFQGILRSLKKAERVDDRYHVDLSREDFFDLADTVDRLAERKKAFITTVKARDLLKILPEVENEPA